MPGRDRTVAVICEYNPFHFGHLHQLGELKGKYKTVIGVMSGDTVQRGEVAIADKYVRARAAVRCGMDAVFSLDSIISSRMERSILMMSVGYCRSMRKEE